VGWQTFGVLDSLLPRVLKLVADRPDRLIVGIAGPPGAGKTTLSRDLWTALLAHGVNASVLPMDGFHLANEELRRLGRADRKGAPDTFDAAGYVAMLWRLCTQSQTVVYAPSFDHVLNEPIAGSIPIPPESRVIVTEGNYLLLDEEPWTAVRPLLDLSVYVDVNSAEDRVAGLIERQLAKGLTPQAARDWVLRSDEANAQLIATASGPADVTLIR
jgi:pantothenate kinase